MDKLKNIAIVALSLSTLYGLNFAYHTKQALDITNDLSRTKTLISLLQDKREKLNNEIFKTSVLMTKNPNEEGLFFRNGHYVNVIASEEQSRLAELGDSNRSIGGDLGEAYVNQSRYESELLEHLRKSYSVF